MRTLALSILAALALAGCSSGGSASALSYSDPTSTGWRLVKDPSSTPSRIVLALVGPSGTMTRGVGFNLQAGSGARWSTFTGGLPIQDTGVFQLRNSQPDPNLPPDPDEYLLLNGGVMDGNVLTVGIFQKDRRVAAKDASRPLLRIAIELDGKAPAGRIPLTLKKAKVLPDDIGAYTDDPVTVLTKSHLDKIDIAVGTLQAS
jgi:hypothetical protein